MEMCRSELHAQSLSRPRTHAQLIAHSSRYPPQAFPCLRRTPVPGDQSDARNRSARDPLPPVTEVLFGTCIPALYQETIG